MSIIDMEGVEGVHCVKRNHSRHRASSDKRLATLTANNFSQSSNTVKGQFILSSTDATISMTLQNNQDHQNQSTRETTQGLSIRKTAILDSASGPNIAQHMRKSSAFFKIDEFLDNLFSEEGDTKVLHRLRRDVKGQGSSILKLHSPFTEHSIQWCLKGLLANELLADDKKVILQEFLKDDVARREICDVLNMKFKDFENWDWDAGEEGVNVEPRRQLNGNWRVMMDGDILQAIFLHYLGMIWAVALKKMLRDCMWNMQAWKRMLRCRSDRKGNEGISWGVGGLVEKPEEVWLLRGEIHYQNDVSMSQLPSSVADGAGGCDDEQEMEMNDYVGERPAPPVLNGIEKIDKRRVLNYTSIQELDEVPEHLIVVGGGYVGVEFAQLFRRLDAVLTILQRGRQLLPREDREIADSLFEKQEEDGLKIHLESSTIGILPIYNEGIEVTFKTKSGEDALSATHILLAGRIPNTHTLILPAAGIPTNPRGYITSNEFLETSNPNVYVMGDVGGSPAFTHISYNDFRIIKANHISPVYTTKFNTKNRLVPYVVYTDPQLSHIGLHEHEARSQFPDANIKVAKMPMSYVARALETDESRGMMKAVVNADTGLILGFTCLGMEGRELMAVVQMAIMGNVGWQTFRDAVWAHPSLAESLNNLWGFLE